MAIKIDMAKAYDMVEWEVLLCIMRLHGFSEKFCNLISECISTPYFSMLINGSPTGFFSALRGIWQGDPISPALCTILSDLLSRILDKAEQAGRLSGVKISRTSPHISHLMYADDLVIYCKATASEASEVVQCLTSYCDWTGQRINWDISVIHFSNNVLASDRRDLCRILTMPECTHSSLYLGTSFKGIMEKLETQLSGWKQKTLSLTG